MRASRGCATTLSSQFETIFLPRAVVRYTVRSEPWSPASVFDARTSPASLRALRDRYTSGRRTCMTAARLSSLLNDFAIANPCAGRSSSSASTRWSSTDGLYSLTVTNLDTKQPKKRWHGVFGVICGVLITASLQLGVSNAHASSSNVQGSITVSAAASLTDVFRALAKEFRKVNPKVRVTFNFGSTSALVAQVQAGAPVDVFAAADTSSIDKLAASGHVTKSPQVFARNTMMIAVKSGNPLRISSLADLSRVSVVALCAKTVPCGVYAGASLQRASVVLAESNITRGVDARATLGAVVNGDADAAIVYTTDVKAAGRSVTAVPLPRIHNVTAMYSIAPIRGSKNAVATRAFIDYVVSPVGRSTLIRFGFLSP